MAEDDGPTGDPDAVRAQILERRRRFVAAAMASVGAAASVAGCELTTVCLSIAPPDSGFGVPQRDAGPTVVPLDPDGECLRQETPADETDGGVEPCVCLTIAALPLPRDGES